jgi:hypothetical protein
MVTRYYLRATSNGASGLPTTEQSTLTNTKTSTDALTVNRTLSSTIGTTQTSLVITSNAAVTAQTFYFTRFVGPPIGAQTIAAATWTYNFAAKQSNISANFPVNGASQPCRVVCYVWRPSSTSVVGTILDGNSASTLTEGATLEVTYPTTFSGAAVTTQNNDVIVFEVWFVVTQSSATAYTDTFYFDGAVVTTSGGSSVTNHASFIECPNTIADPSTSIDMTPNLLTLTNKFITKI